MSAAQPTSISFHGSALSGLGYAILLVVFIVPVVTLGWAMTKFCRWVIENLTFEDGTTARFEGKPMDVLVPSSLSAVVSYPSFVIGLQDLPLGTHVILTLTLIPVQTVALLFIMRWFYAGISLSSGSRLTFTGNYTGLLGWQVLTALAGYTIIGAPFALVAMYRWIFRHVEGGRRRLVFDGSGLALLGQIVLTFLLSLLIVTIPYAMVRLMRWCVSNTRLKPQGAGLNFDPSAA